MALGSYVVLFGGGRPVGERVRAYLISAIGLVLAVAAGMVVGHSTWWTLAAYLVVSVVAVLVTRLVDPGPPGPYFFVLMLGGGTLLTGTGLGIPMTAAYLALGSALAIAAGSLARRSTFRKATRSRSVASRSRRA